MSSTCVLGLTMGDEDTRSVEELVTLKNSHGFAPSIWGDMCQVYLDADPHDWLTDPSVMERLWLLSEDLSVPEAHRAVLFMTYDRVYISKKDYGRAAEDFKLWLKDFPPQFNKVNHMERIKAVFESDPRYDAIGFHVTSITDNPFLIYDEGKEDYVVSDWTDFGDIYKELDELKGK